jgi:hypothetical protein
MADLDAFSIGVLVGVLIGEGHFGGDGKQPQVTLKMHERHEALFRWLEAKVEGSKLYGPYRYDGRAFYQWMARGECLRKTLVPILDEHLTPALDAHVHERYLAMKQRYRLDAGERRAGPSDPM